MVIYKTTNLVNGKIYIGQDKNNNPKYIGSGDLIKKAIEKYGKDNFKKEILIICDNQIDLDEYERFFIKEFDSTNKLTGYNISIGGRNGTTLNRKMSEKTKKQMSNSRNGIIFTKEHKKNLSNAHVGKKISDETKRKMSESQKLVNRKKMSSETKAKISSAKLGKVPSIETKKRMSESHLGVKNSFFGKKHKEGTFINKQKKIIQLTTDGIILREWPSIAEAAKSLGIRSSGISNVLAGRLKSTNNFKFIYKKNE